jgi:5-methylcytosine-specific restriction enzyme A
MSRREFSDKVRRQAWARSALLCEAVGADYGLKPGERCNGDLTGGHDFDHVIPDSIGGEPTLENCAVVCRVCHRRKTAVVDTPRAAKTKRQERMARGPKRSSRMPGSRDSKFKQKIGGGAVLRATGEPVR